MSFQLAPELTDHALHNPFAFRRNPPTLYVMYYYVEKAYIAR